MSIAYLSGAYLSAFIYGRFLALALNVTPGFPGKKKREENVFMTLTPEGNQRNLSFSSN